MKGSGRSANRPAVFVMGCVLVLATSSRPVPAEQITEALVQVEEVSPAGVQEETLIFQGEAGPSTENVPVFSLEQILEIALERNPDIAASGELTRAYEARYKQERGAYLPQLDATVQFHRYWMDLASWATTFGAVYTFPADENYPAATVVLSQYIYDFGKIPGRVTSSRHQFQASEKAHIETLTSVVLETQQAFYEVLKQQGFVSVEEQSVVIYSEHLKRAQDYLE